MVSREALKKYHVSVRMVRAYHDSFLRKPSYNEVLEALADMIKLGQLDDLFIIEIEEKEG